MFIEKVINQILFSMSLTSTGVVVDLFVATATWPHTSVLAHVTKLTIPSQAMTIILIEA